MRESSPAHGVKSFRVGMRVEAVGDSIRANPTHGLTKWKSGMGTITSILKYDLIRVRRDGIKRTATYHINFWKPAL